MDSDVEVTRKRVRDLEVTKRVRWREQLVLSACASPLADVAVIKEELFVQPADIVTTRAEARAEGWIRSRTMNTRSCTEAPKPALTMDQRQQAVQAFAKQIEAHARVADSGLSLLPDAEGLGSPMGSPSQTSPKGVEVAGPSVGPVTHVAVSSAPWPSGSSPPAPEGPGISFPSFNYAPRPRTGSLPVPGPGAFGLPPAKPPHERPSQPQPTPTQPGPSAAAVLPPPRLEHAQSAPAAGAATQPRPVSARNPHGLTMSQRVAALQRPSFGAASATPVFIAGTPRPSAPPGQT